MAPESAIDLLPLAERHVVRRHGELVDAVTPAGAKQPERLRRDAALLLLGLHAQHRLADHDRCRAGRQGRLIGGPDDDRDVSLRRKLPARPRRSLRIALDADIAPRASLQDQACGDAEPRRKLDDIIFGADHQPVQQRARQAKPAGTQHALA
ncbi:hypothetical protein QIH93_18470 [Bradyrhizobium ottawaense]|uniref:Uncharacterized protein n=1 Tax=Bradyrhizobium ottawaense TaxID=931866 RepID=A0ABV4G245_9BRAD|nr:MULTISPECIES: hypothetical protein [Bradyrhizobium]WLB49871.1 hypothetical protein QIH93_18470 [Bradyrhizobium ottawaense]WQN79903.1 hypothetical protein U7859_23110 [Bradyrhizobium ottawaense]BBO06212.1 hypothetical protein SG09_55620 [Bradyrhizobium ottawaense]GMO19002.1 hypothetical protein BwSH14_11440 [Bradyrhizobium ottawaense]GMO20284.1 hypothetical protein BwSF21_13920 [Bradyrhizobium ottawaense]